MKKTALRLTTLGVAAFTATSLVACSGGSAPAESGTGGGTGELSGTLNYPGQYWAETGKDWEHKWVETFEAANPGVTVNLTPVPFAEYHNKMYTDMAAGQAPDIVMPYDPQLGQWIGEGLLEPLDDCLASHDIDVSGFVPAQKAAIVDGHTYAIPIETNPRVLVYNKQLFDDAGVSAPTDLDELKEAIKATTDASIQQFGFGTVTGSESPAATYLDLMPVVAGFGGAFVTDGKATADSDEVVDALSFYKEIYDDGEVAKGQTQASYREAFAAGKTASVAIGGFIFSMVSGKNPAVGQQLDAVPLPLPGDRTISVTVYLSIPVGAKNKAAACELIATSLDPELQKTKAPMSRSIPATGEVDQAFIDENPYFEAIIEAAQSAVSYAPQGAEEHTSEVAQIVTDVYQEMLASPMTGKEAAAKIQSQLEELLNN